MFFSGLALKAQIEFIPFNAERVNLWDWSKTANGSKDRILNLYKGMLDSNEYSYPQKFLYEYMVKSKGAGLNFSGKLVKFAVTDSLRKRIVAYPVADRKACLAAMNKITADFKMTSYYESENYKFIHKTKGKRDYYFYCRNLEFTPEECIILDDKYLFFIRLNTTYYYDSDNDYSYDRYDAIRAADSTAKVVEMDAFEDRYAGRKYGSSPEYDDITNFKLKYWKEHAPQPRYVAAGLHTIFDKLEMDSVYCLDTSELQYWEEERVPESELHKLPNYVNDFNKFSDGLKKAKEEAEKKRLEEEKRKLAEKEKVVELKWIPYFDKGITLPAMNLGSKADFLKRYNEGDEYLVYLDNNEEIRETVGEMAGNRLLSGSGYSKKQSKIDSVYKSLPIYKLIGDHHIFVSVHNSNKELTYKITPGFAPEVIKKAIVPQDEKVVKELISIIKPEHRYNVSLIRLNLPQMIKAYSELSDSFFRSVDLLSSKYSSYSRYNRSFESRIAITGLDLLFRNLSTSDLFRSMEGTMLSTTTGSTSFSYKYSSYVYTDEGEYKDTLLERVINVPSQLVVLPLTNKQNFMEGMSAFFRYNWLKKIDTDLYMFGVGDYERKSNPDEMYKVFVKFSGNNLIISNDSSYIWGKPMTYDNTIPAGLDMKSAFTSVADGGKTREIVYKMMALESKRAKKDVDEMIGSLKTLSSNIENSETIVVKGSFDGDYPEFFYKRLFTSFLNLY